MHISELSRRTGVSADRLRRYESAGLISAARSRGGYRQFTDRAVREVTFISMGRDLGFSLKTLGDVLPKYRARSLSIDEMVGLLRQRIAEVDKEPASRRALRRRLVAHIAWFEQRRPAKE